MGNSQVKTSIACPQIIQINHINNQINVENEHYLDNTDNISIITADIDSPKQPSIIAEVYVRRNFRRKAIIVSKSSKSIDKTEIQNEN